MKYKAQTGDLLPLVGFVTQTQVVSSAVCSGVVCIYSSNVLPSIFFCFLIS